MSNPADGRVRTYCQERLESFGGSAAARATWSGRQAGQGRMHSLVHARTYARTDGRTTGRHSACGPGWRRGVVGRVNEVTLRRARLVLGWGPSYGHATSVCNQATYTNSASYPQRGGNECRPQGGETLHKQASKLYITTTHRQTNSYNSLT